jgi:hypothetical protein
MTVYVVRDGGGEYIRDGYKAGSTARRTAAGNEAHEFDDRDDAKAACERATDKVLTREAE